MLFINLGENVYLKIISEVDVCLLNLPIFLCLGSLFISNTEQETN